jgi:hypothetical protein
MSRMHPRMKAISLLLIVAVSLSIVYSAQADNSVSFTIGKAWVSTKAGAATADEGGTYIIVPITMNNLSSEEKKIGGMLIEGAFKIRQGDFSYSVDGSVGWTLGNRNYYNGLIILQPLLPRTVNMAFTVPTELAQGNFLLALPDGREVNLAVPFRNAGT